MDKNPDLKRKKIVFYTSTDKNTGSTRIRVYNIAQELIKRGYDVSINENLAKADIIVFQKSAYSFLAKKFFRYMFSNKFIIFDIDDLFLDERLNFVINSDFTITSCQYMKEQYLKYNDNIGVLDGTPDVIDEDMPIGKYDLKNPKIGWFGTSVNYKILKFKNIRNVTTITKNGDIEWSLDTVDKNIQKFDLVVLPQLKNPQGLAKDNCRMLKTLYLGIPALISDIPEYVRLAEFLNYPKEFIVKDDEDWNEKIEKIKSGEIKFDFDFNQCRKILKDNYSTKAMTDKWIDIVSKAYSSNNFAKHISRLFKFYFTKRKKIKLPKICLLCDRPNWAHHHSAMEIKKYLDRDFLVDIKFVVDKPKLKPKKYDLLHVFFWDEPYYKKFKFPKRKVIKQVSSHKWQFEKVYGPCTPLEFSRRYLDEAKYVSCPSQILYNLLKDVHPRVFLIGKGYSPEKFYYKEERKGEFSICWAGNIKLTLKGVEDIIIPAAKHRFKLNLASNLPHEELLDFYNANDVYVVASQHEADPLPLIESMACGCFPVANKVGIAPELIRHKENGYLVQERTVEAYIEAFNWCKDNLEYIREQGKKNAKEIFKKRRWEVMAQGYKDMYKECLK